MRGGQQKQDAELETLIPTIGGGFDVARPVAFDWYASQSQSLPVGEQCPPLKTTMQPAVAYTLEARAEVQATMTPAMQVRRLTPRECERLQGFPDDYTLVPHRGKPAADGPRYKALGNSMAVPVMRWIGERIQTVDAIESVQVAVLV